MNFPILYTFRRCPYAMRARMALYHAKINYEHREILLKNRPKKLYEISARLTVKEFEEKIGIFLPKEEKEDVDTVGGLVFNLLGKIPSRGEVINHESGLEFTILDADTRKIKRILVNVK